MAYSKEDDFEYKKTNFVIFCPAQKRLIYQPKIIIFDNKQNKNVALKCKEFIEYLGTLIDCNLSWKHNVDYVTLKVSRVTGLIAKLRYVVPRHTLLTINRSFIAPYKTYGLGVRRVNYLFISYSSCKSEPSVSSIVPTVTSMLSLFLLMPIS